MDTQSSQWMTRFPLLRAVALSLLPMQPLPAQQTPAPPTETIKTAAAHTPTELQIIDLSKTKWDWMADKKVESLATLFDDRAMFTHMGGTWGKTQELATIQSGGIWYKKASIYAVDVRVTFQPGAHTNWHTHPLGQLLIVTAGHGWVQVDGEAAKPIAKGDTVFISPGVKHWHGAARDTAMTHVAVSEALDGTSVNWLEPVAEDLYNKL